jgi:hypothetical protein
MSPRLLTSRLYGYSLAAACKEMEVFLVHGRENSIAGTSERSMAIALARPRHQYT